MGYKELISDVLGTKVSEEEATSHKDMFDSALNELHQDYRRVVEMLYGLGEYTSPSELENIAALENIPLNETKRRTGYALSRMKRLIGQQSDHAQS